MAKRRTAPWLLFGVLVGSCGLLSCEHASGPGARPLQPISIPLLTLEEALDVGEHIRDETFARNPRSACMPGPFLGHDGRPTGIRYMHLAIVLPDRSLLRIRAFTGDPRATGIEVLRNWEHGKALVVRWYPTSDRLLYGRYQITAQGLVGADDSVAVARVRAQIEHLRARMTALGCPASLNRDLELDEFLADSRGSLSSGPAWLNRWYFELPRRL